MKTRVVVDERISFIKHDNSNYNQSEITIFEYTIIHTLAFSETIRVSWICIELPQNNERSIIVLVVT